ncbi:MAG TPA: DUF6376 family protein [Bacillus sp. (in: firmicutes)]|uniref:DUF6376 family protein n=1 Tax=Bacillus litorisediminis TaxID=2922713 RepID=UPI001FACDB44|nr:DUF6376 family protein [Bacillus litorisediminis]HWO78287.1 DUF6376 family protein [Bacillus sp. (in: firmicutes)]
MKKWISLFAMLLFLSGCSFLEDVNNTLDYVNEATEYINEASQFANEVQTLAEQAASDPNALAELEERLHMMQGEIEEFNSLNPPGIAEDIHQTIEGYNQTIQAAIDSSLEKIEQGQLQLNELLNSELMQTFENLQNTLNQLEQLGN